MPVNHDLDELIGKPPHWLVRWGITVFVLIIILVSLIAWLVPYPETRSFNMQLERTHATTYIPEKDIAVIKSGQQAIVKLNAFTKPVTGAVSVVSNERSDSGYLATIVFPHGLVTREGTTLPYKEGYTGTVKIIIRRGSFLNKMFGRK